jgi:hypothetical protein
MNLHERHCTSVALLVDSYDEQLGKQLGQTSPFLLPLKCAVVVEGKGIKFDVSLRSTDTVKLSDANDALTFSIIDTAGRRAGAAEIQNSGKRQPHHELRR